MIAFTIVLLIGLFIAIVHAMELSDQRDLYQERLESSRQQCSRLRFHVDHVTTTLSESHAEEIEALGHETAGLYSELDHANAEISELIGQRNEIYGRYHRQLTRAFTIRKSLEDVSENMPARRQLHGHYRTLLAKVMSVRESLEDVS